jgi:anti-anti-sigma factor
LPTLGIDEGVAMAAPFSIQFAQVDGQTVARLVGELDMAQADEAVEQARRALCNGYTGPLVVDVSELRSCDSSGIRALMHIERLASEHERDMVLRFPGRVLRQVLNVLGMESYFRLDEPQDLAPT